MTARRVFAALLLAGLTAAAPAPAQDSYRPSPENLAARDWFRDARFGLFIHWGASSVLGAGEWVMRERRFQVSDYERIAQQFNPVRFDAAAWVSLARAAGMRYITLIAKHHDGFALWDSKVSDWDVVERTPYGRDIVRQLADECHRQGIRLFLYYSQLDWHHPDYFPRGQTAWDNGRPNAGDFQRYLDYMDAQLTELLTGYGPIGGIWFDGMWDKPDADWRLRRTYDLIHRLQPAALVIPNHHRAPLDGEDVQTFEKDLPGGNTAGFNTTTVGALPLETSETINGAWGFNLTDRSYKSSDDLVRYLVRAAGNDANFLLNVGPMPTGEIQPEFQVRLRAMGAWLAHSGTAIYGTRGGPVAPADWGVTTQRGDTVFVHVLRWTGRLLALPPLPHRVRAARLLRDNSGIAVFERPEGVVLTLPERPVDLVDEIVVLQLAR
jgi:alpha-L-fucosidase